MNWVTRGLSKRTRPRALAFIQLAALEQIPLSWGNAKRYRVSARSLAAAVREAEAMFWIIVDRQSGLCTLTSEGAVALKTYRDTVDLDF
jgi:hypothetical protein